MLLVMMVRVMVVVAVFGTLSGTPGRRRIIRVVISGGFVVQLPPFGFGRVRRGRAGGGGGRGGGVGGASSGGARRRRSRTATAAGAGHLKREEKCTKDTLKVTLRGNFALNNKKGNF